jgi:formylmethanofuran dehydrogenase subunit E
VTITFQNGSTITPLECGKVVRSNPHYSCVVCGKGMYIVRTVSDDGDPVCENCWEDYCSHFEE